MKDDFKSYKEAWLTLNGITNAANTVEKGGYLLNVFYKTM